MHMKESIKMYLTDYVYLQGSVLNYLAMHMKETIKMYLTDW